MEGQGMIDDFLAQYPASTRASYGQVLADFGALLAVDPVLATQDDMVAYGKAINEQASGTVYKKLAIMRSFYTYLIKRGVRSDNPALIVRVPKVDRLRAIQYLSEDQVGLIFANFTDSRKDIRDRAIFGVFLHGLRLAELVSLNVEDYRNGELRFVGKGNKTRLVPVVGDVPQYLQAYLGRRKSGPMFLSVNRRSDRIERRAVQNIVYEVTDRIGARMSPHKLRHTFATNAHRNKVDLLDLQRILGHSNPATTAIYAHLDTTDLRAAMEQANILGKKPTLHLVENIA